MQPFHTVVAPFVHMPVLLYLHHILVCSRHHDTDSPYLVGGNLPFDACRLDAMRYRFITYRHTFGKFHQFPIKMCTCRIHIRSYHPALDMVGHTSVRCSLCFLEIKGEISHVVICFSLDNSVCLAHSPHGSRGFKRGIAPLLNRAFLAVLALREENALLSYGFSLLKSLWKACGNYILNPLLFFLADCCSCLSACLTVCDCLTCCVKSADCTNRFPHK